MGSELHILALLPAHSLHQSKHDVRICRVHQRTPATIKPWLPCLSIGDGLYSSNCKPKQTFTSLSNTARKVMNTEHANQVDHGVQDAGFDNEKPHSHPVHLNSQRQPRHLDWSFFSSSICSTVLCRACSPSGPCLPALHILSSKPLFSL